MYISNILTRLPRNFSSREFIQGTTRNKQKDYSGTSVAVFLSYFLAFPPCFSVVFVCLLLLFCSSLQWAPLLLMIKSMSLSFWSNLRLFQNNKPLVIFLNHFSNTSFFLGLYQVLLRSNLFQDLFSRWCLSQKRLKWMCGNLS